MVKLEKYDRDIKSFFVTPVSKFKPTPVSTGSKSWLNLKAASSSDLHGITIRMVCTASREYCPS